MKIVFQNVPEWEGVPHAEAELAERMVFAAKVIGLDAIASSDISNISVFQPDIVIPLHFCIPKLFDSFTIGCMWNPSSMIKGYRNWRNVKSYDGYGIASESQDQLVRALKFKSPVPYLRTKIYPSTNATEFCKPKQFFNPVYVGTNWNRDRHKDFFESTEKIQIYGPKERWRNIAKKIDIYKGVIPCDGKSLLKIYHEAGIGLALHHESHNQEEIPSMRPFEIAASCAVMIADENIFVRRVFGENALYLDKSLGPKDMADQLNMHVDWIKTHSRQAQEMTYSCHKIFNNQYSLEVLLDNLLKDYSEFKKVNALVIQEKIPPVEIIIQSDGADGSQRNKLFRAINSIKQQTYPNVSARIIFRGEKENLKNIKEYIKKEFPHFDIKFTLTEKTTDRGSRLFTGVRSSCAQYVGFINDNEIIFKDHVEILANILTNDARVGIVHSGCVRVSEGLKHHSEKHVRKLVHYCDLDTVMAKPYIIASNSYLVRRAELPWQMLNNPIPLVDLNDNTHFLKLMSLFDTKYVFSEKVTCAYFRSDRKENYSDRIQNFPLCFKSNDKTVMNLATLSLRGRRITCDKQYFISIVVIKNIVRALQKDFNLVIFRVKKFIKCLF